MRFFSFVLGITLFILAGIITIYIYDPGEPGAIIRILPFVLCSFGTMALLISKQVQCEEALKKLKL